MIIFFVQSEKRETLNCQNAQRYLKKYSGIRSAMETWFANFENLFRRFHPQSNIFIGDERLYTVQMKVAVLLYNIKRFENEYGLEVQPHHRLWVDNGFDFPCDDPKFDLDERVKVEMEKVKRMKNRQNKLLDALLNESNAVDDCMTNTK